MKTARLHEYGAPEKLVYEEAPDPVMGPDDILLQVLGVSINPIDWKMRKGILAGWIKKTFPIILGWDVAGTVLKAGANVKEFKPGDRVFGPLDIMRDGAYAEKVAVDPTKMQLALLPDGLDPVLAAAIPMISRTGIQLVDQIIKPKSGERMLVTGAVGGVGRFTVYAALAAGVRVVAGIRGRQKELAQKLFGSAVEVMALDDAAAVAAMGTVDAIADTLGGDASAKLLDHIKPGGFLGTALNLPALPAGTALRTGSISAKPSRADILRAVSAVQKGEIRVEVEHKIPLSQAARAHQLAEAGGLSGKIVLIP